MSDQIVRADAAQRAEAMWLARIGGATWEQARVIGGYSDIPHAIRAVRSYYGELPKLDRTELRGIWRERLEQIWRQLTEDMRDRVPGSTTSAVRVVTAAAALDGLNEPTRVDVAGVESFANWFEKELRDEGFF